MATKPAPAPKPRKLSQSTAAPGQTRNQAIKLDLDQDPLSGQQVKSHEDGLIKPIPTSNQTEIVNKSESQKPQTNFLNHHQQQRHRGIDQSNDVLSLDAKGHILKAEVREDEEQAKKLEEIVELLVAAGYFRARIKGLSAFDKIVGGMSWAIEMSSWMDLDIDLLFQESLSIGQKIALTEKIVAVLRNMQCPYRLEPHQIQGLDCIHIFPVIQWLVKKSIESRDALRDYMTQVAVTQFNRSHPELQVAQPPNDTDIDVPRRRYRYAAAAKVIDEDSSVRTTLLEFGTSSPVHIPHAKQGEQNQAKTDQKSSASGDISATADESNTKLMSHLTEESPNVSNRVSKSVVGSVVEAQSDEIAKLAQEYMQKQTLIEEDQETVLRRQIAAKQRQLQNLSELEQEVQEKFDKLNQELAIIKNRKEELRPLAEQNSREERAQKKELRSMYEKLVKEKAALKEQIRGEKAKLEGELEELTKHDEGSSSTDQDYDPEEERELESQLAREQEKLAKIRQKLGDVNREIVKVERKLDDIPSRAELSQYQKRFVELYNQVAAKHNETKKFYTQFNTLQDIRLYLDRELTMINSIVDNFEQAASTASLQQQFLQQFEQIVENVKASRDKVEKRRQMEKVKRDNLNDTYLDLIEKQRLYFKAIKEFKEECRKNEILIGQLQLTPESLRKDRSSTGRKNQRPSSDYDDEDQDED